MRGFCIRPEGVIVIDYYGYYDTTKRSANSTIPSVWEPGLAVLNLEMDHEAEVTYPKSSSRCFGE